ncbi:hypothetical protein [Uliginosibacterium sp. TH139]|uniref:hypothetical protein n=1 Tax=Uliginosibacterium sp. TH139 TaxID=2067453 RepID=UPI0013042BFD|nr:hypothetical protein [Uliginosibacterium sp. TH139]
MPQDGFLAPDLQRIECDFNAVGLSDEPNDNCFYSFHREQVVLLNALIGAKVILYAHDSPSEITACEAWIEVYRSGWQGEPDQSFMFCGFRARPIEGSWFSGAVSRLGRFS